MIGKIQFRREGHLIKRGKRGKRGHRISHINKLFFLRFLLAVEKRNEKREDLLIQLFKSWPT